MSIVFTNGASSLLAVGISAIDTTVQVGAGEGALFPAPSGGNYFKLALVNAAGDIEIMHCTSRSTDLLTVTRAQEGTTARAFTATVTRCELRITAGTMEALYQAGGTDVPVADGGTGASTAADARTNLGLGTMAVQNANSVNISGGAVAGITDLAVADGGTGASTAANARTNLGLGTMAVVNSPAPVANGGTAATDAATARSNLGAAAASHTHTLADITDDGSIASKNITVSTSDPSGTPGDGDLWVKYTP